MDLRKLINTMEDISADDTPQIGDIVEIELGDTLLETYVEDITEDGVIIKVDETALKMIINAKKQLQETKNLRQGVAEGKTNKKLNEVSPEYARAAADATYTKGGDIDKRIQQHQKDSLRSLPTDLQQQFDRRANFQRYADQKRKQITPEIDVIYYGINSYGSDALMRRNLINKFPNIVNVNNANLVLDLVKQVKEKKISLEKAAYQLYISNLKAKQNNASVPAAPTTANEGIYPGKTIAGPVTGYSDLGPNAKILARRTEEAFKNPRLVAELQSIARRIEEIDPGSISLVISYYLGPKSHYEDADPKKEELRKFLEKHLLSLIATDTTPAPKQQGVAEGQESDDLLEKLMTLAGTKTNTKVLENIYGKVEPKEGKYYLLSIYGAGLLADIENPDEPLEFDSYDDVYDYRRNFNGREDDEYSSVIYKNGQFYGVDYQGKPYIDKELEEAKYKGREVPLGKPMKGDVAKSKVYVRGPKGNVVKVNFGDKNMRIKKSNPKRRKSFRARHRCDNPGPRWKARYWSCRAW